LLFGLKPQGVGMPFHNAIGYRFAYRIKIRFSGHAFSQCNQLQIEVMVWFVCATSSQAVQWLK